MDFLENNFKLSNVYDLSNQDIYNNEYQKITSYYHDYNGILLNSNGCSLMNNGEIVLKSENNEIDLLSNKLVNVGNIEYDDGFVFDFNNKNLINVSQLIDINENKILTNYSNLDNSNSAYNVLANLKINGSPNKVEINFVDSESESKYRLTHFQNTLTREQYNSYKNQYNIKRYYTTWAIKSNKIDSFKEQIGLINDSIKNPLLLPDNDNSFHYNIIWDIEYPKTKYSRNNGKLNIYGIDIQNLNNQAFSEQDYILSYKSKFLDISIYITNRFI